MMKEPSPYGNPNLTGRLIEAGVDLDTLPEDVARAAFGYPELVARIENGDTGIEGIRRKASQSANEASKKIVEDASMSKQLHADAEKIISSPELRNARMTLSEIEEASELADALALEMTFAFTTKDRPGKPDILTPSEREFIHSAIEFWELIAELTPIMNRLRVSFSKGIPAETSPEGQEVGTNALKAQEKFLYLYRKVLSEKDTPKKQVSICAECKQPFFPRRAGQMYHTTQCADRARKRRLRKAAIEKIPVE